MRWMSWSDGCGASSTPTAIPLSSTRCEAWVTCSRSSLPAMPLSRIRLRLAGWFALAFVLGLLGLSLTLFLYMRKQNEARFNRQLSLTAEELLNAIRAEYAEAPDSGVAAATAAA